MSNVDGWAVTVTYEDGTKAGFFIQSLGEFQTIIPAMIKTGHGNIATIEMR